MYRLTCLPFVIAIDGYYFYYVGCKYRIQENLWDGCQLLTLYIRAVPDLFFCNPTGTGFCRIWNAGAGAGFSN